MFKGNGDSVALAPRLCLISSTGGDEELGDSADIVTAAGFFSYSWTSHPVGLPMP